MQTDSRGPSKATFTDWTNDREIASLASNAGAAILPFQNWQKVKEAFAPELVARALEESPYAVQRCIDPFGGSGTTGLACQFLGIHPTICEVNPYLADLIESKLYPYVSPTRLTSDLKNILQRALDSAPDDLPERYSSGPRTLIEPGYNDRWIFDRLAAERIAAISDAIAEVDDVSHRRFFRVILGGILVAVSNVTISGKGRRYRKQWRQRRISPHDVSDRFVAAAARAINDVERFLNRGVTTYQVLRGDSRETLREVEPCQLAVFSPPYLNSADYTDVYNLELWILGYLDGRSANTNLRLSTMSSHVQISREFCAPPDGSSALDHALQSLNIQRHALWDQRIPEMVGAYFSDLLRVLNHLKRILTEGATAWIVLSDSRYQGIHIPVTTVLQELISHRGWTVIAREPVRSISTSAQQGGKKELSEQLLIILNDRP